MSEAIAMTKLTSILTCPVCGHRLQLEMPTDACVYRQMCLMCGYEMRALPGQCCVFCSFGDTPCPPLQDDAQCECDAGVAMRRSR